MPPPPPLPPPELPAMGGGRPHGACAPPRTCSVIGAVSQPAPPPPPPNCGCPEAERCQSDEKSAAPGFTNSTRKSRDRAGETVLGGVLQVMGFPPEERTQT